VEDKTYTCDRCRANMMADLEARGPKEPPFIGEYPSAVIPVEPKRFSSHGLDVAVEPQYIISYSDGASEKRPAHLCPDCVKELRAALGPLREWVKRKEMNHNE
jgi:hypothetical protein